MSLFTVYIQTNFLPERDLINKGTIVNKNNERKITILQ